MAFSRGRRPRSRWSCALVGYSLVSVAATSCSAEIPEDLFPAPGGGHGGDTTSAGRLNRAGEAGQLNRAGEGGRGGAPTGGSANLGGRDEPAEQGGGGQAAQACDDENACTTDTRDAQGCRHVPVVCPMAAACKIAVCEPALGCTSKNAPDGTACDDGKLCTSSDVCELGTCAGDLPSFEVERSVMEDIPDGQEMCHGVRGELAVSFEVASEARVGGVVLYIDFEHSYVSELRIELRHEATGRRARILWNPDAPNTRVDGVFRFDEDAAPFPEQPSGGEIASGSYAPLDPFGEAFGGAELGGTWTLLFGDLCENDVGYVRSASLELVGAPCP